MASTFHVRRRHRQGGVIPALACTLSFLTLLLVTGCSDTVTEPGGTQEEDTLFDGSYDPQSGQMEFALTSPSGQVIPLLRLVATDVQLDTQGLLHAQVAIHNIGTESVMGPFGVFVSHFLPASVYPMNATCPRDSTDPMPPVPQPDSLPGDSTVAIPFPASPCYFDHRGTYGEDGMLVGGETSEPVEWIFGGTGGQSFAFRAQLGKEAIPAEGLITGIVFEDLDENGHHDLSEPGLAGVGVGLVVGDVMRIQKTDSRGRYAFEVTDPGLYPLSLSIPDGARPTGPTELQVLIVRDASGQLSNFIDGDFGLVTLLPWEELSIQGVVFMDLNRNGVREPDEGGVPGVPLSASSLICESPIAAQAYSDTDGHYLIEGRDVHCPLPWMLLRHPVAGLSGTTPAQVELSRPPSQGSVFHVDFGMAPEDSVHPVNVTITGLVFVDLNANGSFDNNDSPLPGVEVQLLSPCDVLRAATTDSTGHYLFEPDVVRMCPVTGVWQSRPVYFGHTTPNPAAIQMPTVPGNHRIQVNFGIGPYR